MAEKSFTLFEPHFHGDFSIGPTTIEESTAHGDNDNAGGVGRLILWLFLAIAAIGVAIAISQKVNET